MPNARSRASSTRTQQSPSRTTDNVVTRRNRCARAHRAAPGFIAAALFPVDLREVRS